MSYIELSERGVGQVWSTPEEFTTATGCHILPDYGRPPRKWSVNPEAVPAGAVVPTMTPTAIGVVHSDPYTPDPRDAVPNLACLATAKPYVPPVLAPLANFLGVVAERQPWRCTLEEAQGLIARVNAAIPGFFTEAPREWNLGGSYAYNYAGTPYRAYRANGVDLAQLLQHERRGGLAILQAVWVNGKLQDREVPVGQWIKTPEGTVHFELDPRIGRVGEFASPVARPRPVLLEAGEELWADRVGGPMADLKVWVRLPQPEGSAPGGPVGVDLAGIAQGMTEIYTLVAELHQKVAAQTVEIAALRAQLGVGERP